MLWLGLHFPSLPLAVFERGAMQPGPLAVIAASRGSATIVTCNADACRRGLRAGMTTAAAWALVPNLAVVARDESAERAALQRIAAWALQFTAVVCVTEPDGLLLELGASLKLFGGLDRLCARIDAGLRDLGYGAHLACAPTPAAAQLLARAALAARIQQFDELQRTLMPLPVALLGCDAATVLKLEGFGASTLGDCLALPRAGLSRRVGPQLLDTLDRLLGNIPDPRRPSTPPRTFNATLSLPAPVDDVQALLFAARRLIEELCGMLAATAQGAGALRFTLAHETGAATVVTLALVSANRDASHLVNVLRERLHRLRLPSAATAVTLAVDDFLPLAAASASFLPETGLGTVAVSRLVERLRARLGENTVAGITVFADHRPERAWQVCEPGSGTPPPDAPAASHRPLWLLPAPQPLAEIRSVPQHGGPLSLLSGPERIEAGWWDGNPVARDYFIACNATQAMYWIYRERATGGRWHLHGIFA